MLKASAGERLRYALIAKFAKRKNRISGRTGSGNPDFLAWLDSLGQAGSNGTPTIPVSALEVNKKCEITGYSA